MQVIEPIDIADLTKFLPCATPKAWIKEALAHIELLLIDHAHCEKKAASTALSLLYRYPDKTTLLIKLSAIVREEMLHFEKVIRLMEKRGIAYCHLAPARYAARLLIHVDKKEPLRLVDTLIVSAIIEARSCERFASLIPYLDKELALFYRSLLKSEARHFKDYLSLAQKYSPISIDSRVSFFIKQEQKLIEEKDSLFRFHSGPLLIHP